MVSGIGLRTGPIVIAFSMDVFSVSFYFWGIAMVFGLILISTVVRINLREGIALEDQSTLIAGSIGTPIAEFNAPDPIDYAKAVANHEVEQLDEREDTTERQL
ncbi:MAG: hypothetical protein GY815_20075 [Gammaproteobacteria bacterium]|nr:hypothetical protein [Gammaproteobacteria bacterium]